MKAGNRRPAGYLLAAVVLGVASTGLQLLAFAALGRSLYAHGHPPTYLIIAAPLAAAFIAEGAASAVAGRAGVTVAAGLRRRALDAVLRADPDAARHSGIGDALAIGFDLDLIGSFLITTGPGAALGVIETTAATIIFAVQSPHPKISTLIVVVSAAVLAALAVRLYRDRRDWTASRRTFTGRLVERLIGQRTITIQDDAAKAAVEGTRRLDHYLTRSRWLDAANVAVIGLPLVMGTALIAVAALAHAPAAVIATGLGAALIAARGIGRIAAAAADGAAALDAWHGIQALELLARTAVEPGDLDRRESSGPLLVGEDLLHVVSQEDGLCGRQVNVIVQPGDRLLLTGASGSGKTTLAQILSGHRAPAAGTVQRFGSITRVPQAGDDHILHASLLFNLLCGRHWPPRLADVEQATRLLEQLGLTDITDRMPAGLGQPVGDGGWRLSAGEQARISLARALLTNPDILILDETTAPLDPISRSQLLTVAQDNCQAVIVIAHPNQSEVETADPRGLSR